MKAIAIVLLLAAPALAGGDRLKPNYKVTRMSIQDVGVSCWNGQPPDVERVGNTIVVSCDAQ